MTLTRYAFRNNELVPEPDGPVVKWEEVRELDMDNLILKAKERYEAKVFAGDTRLMNKAAATMKKGKLVVLSLRAQLAAAEGEVKRLQGEVQIKVHDCCKAEKDALKRDLEAAREGEIHQLTNEVSDLRGYAKLVRSLVVPLASKILGYDAPPVKEDSHE